MILIITNKQDFTADLVVLALQERDIPYARFNTEDFPQRVLLNLELTSDAPDGFLRLRKGILKLSDIKSVWFRRPVAPIVSNSIVDPGISAFAQRESQEALSGLWRTLDCYWISHPDAINQASYKTKQLVIARRIGFTVPRSLISNSSTSAEDFRLKCGGKIVGKTLHSGALEIQGNVNVIYTTRLEQ